MDPRFSFVGQAGRERSPYHGDSGLENQAA
jgi:hypothetical protein